MITRLKAMIMLLALLSIVVNGYSQEEKKDKKEVVLQQLGEKKFTFVAQSMRPMRGGTRQLTTQYEVKVTADTVDSFLPYAGRAQSVSMNPSEQGLTFKSTNFDYVKEEGKKGRITITISFKDVSDPRKMIFTIYADGITSLQVTCNNRDPISFDGYLRGSQ
ncbi:DUF4251 domain-containing protein [Flavihumibacter rivuli]|uniref:DUF4251 domain-containing protein n=1 Tax=Flavihumibacter rivuli TaxID=2838156 RepID=UPI001BDDEDC4|nr:DUF4251 domain-containing protein [Flavihumibacter rivuli]ULQ55561.1 DUF4251 domain-containing protein [Flavihumibacter rivuli]